MEFKAIKCPNCGSKLDVKPNEKGMVTCQFCRTDFSVETDYSKSYDTTKGMLDAQKDAFNETLNSDAFKGFRIARIIPFILFAVIFCTVVVIMITGFINMRKDDFNWQFETHTGTQEVFILNGVFDDAITSNQTNKRKIELCLDKKCTKDINEMVKLKDTLDDNKKYEVVLNYEHGYVSRINITTKNK